MASSNQPASQPPKVPFITVEEHWWSPSGSDGLSDKAIAKNGFPPSRIELLQDVSPNGSRLADMDKNSIALQIVSHAPVALDPVGPNTQSVPVDECSKSNDELAERINPAAMSKRFKGFARLPMHDPEAAARELRRTVAEHGFVGSLVDNTLLTANPKTGSVFYDHVSYDAVWQACVDLDVPFFLHPCYPPEDPSTPQYRFQPSEGGSFPDMVGVMLANFGFGWHIDTGLHFLRLVGAGVFDRFPKLKFILGHLGESVPFFLERADRLMGLTNPDLKRQLSEVWNENVWLATSGFTGKGPTAAALAVTRPERIMFAVDYPFGHNDGGVKYLEWLWESGMVTPKQWEGIAYRNALELFGWNEADLVKV